MKPSLNKSCTVCSEPASGYRNTTAGGATAPGARWEPRCEAHNPYQHSPAGGLPDRASDTLPLRPGDCVELLPGAPICATAGVYAGARGRVLRASLEPGSRALGVSWVTVRFDRWGDLVQVPRAYRHQRGTPWQPPDGCGRTDRRAPSGNGRAPPACGVARHARWAAEKAPIMNVLHLTNEQVVSISRAADALTEGDRAGRSAHPRESFSLCLARSVESALRATHPRATDAEIDFATSVYWTSILHDIRVEQRALG